MTSLERISNAPLFSELNTGESAMITGGEAVPASHDFVQNADGTMTYIGPDYIIEPAKPAGTPTAA